MSMPRGFSADRGPGRPRAQGAPAAGRSYTGARRLDNKMTTDLGVRRYLWEEKKDLKCPREAGALHNTGTRASHATP